MTMFARIGALLLGSFSWAYAESVVPRALQTKLENVQNREKVLESQFSLLQAKELLTLETTLRSAMQQFEKNEAKNLLDTDPTYLPLVNEYGALLISMDKDLTGTYYDALFWARYIPAYAYQEDVTDITKEKITFPLSTTTLKILKDFSQSFYAYKSFFEQWPLDNQKVPFALYYQKAKDAYTTFSNTQSFVASLLAHQQDIGATQQQLDLLIDKFKPLAVQLDAPTLSDKSQYEHVLSVYAAQIKDTDSQTYLEYKAWSYIASLLYYRVRAGIPNPDDATNAQLVHTQYNGLSDVVGKFKSSWKFYKPVTEFFGRLEAYDQACRDLLEPKQPTPTKPPLPQPPHTQPIDQPVSKQPVESKPQPAPVTNHSAPHDDDPKNHPVEETITVVDKLNDFIEKRFADHALQSVTNTVALLKSYDHLLQEYKKSKYYGDQDYMDYILWKDFVPLRIAEFDVLKLTIHDPKSQRQTVSFNYTQALRTFRQTPSWARMRYAYPGLFKELTEICADYATWIGQQR